MARELPKDLGRVSKDAERFGDLMVNYTAEGARRTAARIDAPEKNDAAVVADDGPAAEEKVEKP
jgi:hypothetical protein